MLEGFFRDLGGRLYKENDLSDVTWGLANNCEKFLETFMDFLGFDFNPNLPTEIVREDSLGEGNRPDFLIENGDTIFIVESKIYDKNCHIERYGKRKVIRGKKIGRLGLITNYGIDDITRAKARGCNFTDPKTWEEFTKHLDSKLHSRVFPVEWEPVISGYTEYIKEVCSIMKIEEIRFGSLSSLGYFNRLIKKTIEQFQSQLFDCRLYKIGRAFGEYWSGQYFSLQKRGNKLVIYPFFGVYYKDGPPSILFSFENEKGWCKEIYDNLKGKDKEGDFFNVSSDKNEVTFELNDKMYDKFIKASVNQQEVVLKEFFERMVDQISNYL